MVVKDNLCLEEKKVDSTGLEPASLGFAPIALPIEPTGDSELPAIQTSHRQTDRQTYNTERWKARIMTENQHQSRPSY